MRTTREDETLGLFTTSTPLDKENIPGGGLAPDRETELRLRAEIDRNISLSKKSNKAKKKEEQP